MTLRRSFQAISRIASKAKARHQDALVDGFAAQVLQRGEQGEMPRRVASGRVCAR
jgi:hypothetical protein